MSDVLGLPIWEHNHRSASFILATALYIGRSVLTREVCEWLWPEEIWESSNVSKSMVVAAHVGRSLMQQACDCGNKPGQTRSNSKHPWLGLLTHVGSLFCFWWFCLFGPPPNSNLSCSFGVAIVEMMWSQDGVQTFAHSSIQYDVWFNVILHDMILRHIITDITAFSYQTQKELGWLLEGGHIAERPGWKTCCC